MNIDEQPRLLSVDDDAMMREITVDELGGNYRVLTAKSGEECLEILQNTSVDLILLDVEMPGIGGYETCRRIKADSGLADIPVVFLSGHIHIEDRLRGYEAGGDDYVIKPYDPVELEAKVRNLLHLRKERAQLKEMVAYASSTAMTAMTSLGEMGALLETIKRFNTCNTLTALADACLEGLALYGLQGAVQVRTATGMQTRTGEGEASPLIVSIFRHMDAMERITTFKSYMCITFEHVSLLVNNMPEDDPERNGRLRDHLSMMTEGADVRVQTIALDDALNRFVKKLTETLAGIDEAQRKNGCAINLSINALNDDINRAYNFIGLTESQEQFMSQIIQKGIERILNAKSASLEAQDKLSSLINDWRIERA